MEIQNVREVKIKQKDRKINLKKVFIKVKKWKVGGKVFLSRLFFKKFNVYNRV